MMKSQITLVAVLLAAVGCSDGTNITDPADDANQSTDLDNELRERVRAASGGVGLSFYQLPESDDFVAIPQDPQNPITANKVVLGQMLYHDTAFALQGVSGEQQTWSCATCHHAGAGFKAGVIQGIGEGGRHFGLDGSERSLKDEFADGNASDHIPDTQPVTSPTILNVAYQEVMLWNGQFGNAINGNVNAGIPNEILSEEDTPMANNDRQFAGVEIQAVAGLTVHRMEVATDTALQTNPEYINLWQAAYPSGSDDILEDDGLAIAAYERTVLANQAPFQLWLRGNDSAMNDAEKRGGVLFFGKADCVGCHNGPALSSPVGATEDQMFAAIGLNDFSINDPGVFGEVDDRTSRGRGGFTGESAKNFQFKIPQLYNLDDTDVFGHGGSFRSIRELIEYKNRAIPEATIPAESIDSRFVELNLNPEEIDDMEHFLKTALYDPNLLRYQPNAVPSGQCIIVDPVDETRSAFCP